MPQPLRYHGPCDGCCIPAIEATEFLEAHVNELEKTLTAEQEAAIALAARLQTEIQMLKNRITELERK